MIPVHAVLPTNGRPKEALRRLLASLIEGGAVEAVLVPAAAACGQAMMPTLISDPDKLDRADPLAPVVWTQGGTVVSALTYQTDGASVAAVLRSCEVRAFVELTKLNQGSRDGVLLIGVDCFGRFENRDYAELSKRGDLTERFLRRVCSDGDTAVDGREVARACRICEYPAAPNVDVRVVLIGLDPFVEVVLEAETESGEKALRAAGLELSKRSGDSSALEAMIERRITERDTLFRAYEARTSAAEGLLGAIAGCITCCNCRVVCPVCYCRSCVFDTELFQHSQEKYLSICRRDGSLRMPADTTFYHLTRMVHMSTLCVGCGQCSSACPNGIDVMELFRTTAFRTQARFGYVPGRDFDEKQPMSTFHEDELQDAGLGK